MFALGTPAPLRAPPPPASAEAARPPPGGVKDMDGKRRRDLVPTGRFNQPLSYGEQVLFGLDSIS